MRVEQAAGLQWPEERLSRAEVCRRYILAGLMLQKAKHDDQVAVLKRSQMTMTAPIEKLKH
jgi:hypothetical protein